MIAWGLQAPICVHTDVLRGSHCASLWGINMTGHVLSSECLEGSSCIILAQVLCSQPMLQQILTNHIVAFDH